MSSHARQPRSTPPRGRRLAGWLVVAVLLVLIPIGLIDSFDTGEGRVLRDDGEFTAGEDLSTGEVVLLFVLAPLVLMGLCYALAYLPAFVRGGSSRPERAWSGDAVWFAGPDDAEDAVRGARVGAGARGGARGSW